jgi:REP element-mobilizing transposase RayT/TusA-related sulfurtransferase
MTRQARTYGESGIYHIMLRGNECKEIFIDDEDRQRFVSTVFDKAFEEKAEIYAYCLMDNHVHLLFGEVANNFGRLMKRINVSYAYYFNKKYKRIGHLFQDRFRSENIGSDAYILEAVRYIHNNPVKAGMVKTPGEYCWSSYGDYIDARIRSNLAVGKVLDIFTDNRQTAIKQFLAFSNKFGEHEFIDYEERNSEEKRENQEKEAQNDLQKILSLKGLCSKDLLSRDKAAQRNEVVKCLKEKYNLSVRQMEKITGINRGTVLKIYNKMGDNVNKNRPR